MVIAAVALWGCWTAATYLLEGLPRTLLRPEAIELRLMYALVANILIGIVGAGAVLHYFTGHAGITPHDVGFRPVGRTAAGLALGFSLGLAAFLFQRPVSAAPVVLVNAFAQVWVVSVAEILVCWAVLGRTMQIIGARNVHRRAAIGLAVIIAAVAFGLYHFAHSPPFNTLRMVGLLTVVGLGTGAFFFTVGEIYGTIVFHNFLALKGVTDALAAGGSLDRYAAFQMPLILSAVLATGALIAVDQHLRRRAARY